MKETFYVGKQSNRKNQHKMLIISPAQCRAARALIGWTQPKLAKAANLGLSTVVDFEKERRTLSAQSIRCLTDTLQNAGIEFIAENGGGAGVRLKKRPDVPGDQS